MESEELELVYPARQKMATLSSCFAQLTHKAQTVFQNSAKIEVSFLPDSLSSILTFSI